jgi:hypothetical protein
MQKNDHYNKNTNFRPMLAKLAENSDYNIDPYRFNTTFPIIFCAQLFKTAPIVTS